ncbi:T9SS type A sorting domain-containing protein [Aureispira sp. CCB-QB1]|uniref:DUF7619 domain-containing protein n=1 Tax=Aureispira sp. CCB-QB1 TaxID=1313421 RepID=UPI0018CBF9CA|nr:T9SS type A sorting domain-containing protein [Aureispira sp. CCB-QB1]
MMKIIQSKNKFQLYGTIVCLLLYCSLAQAQTTTIPDANFEQKLINLGIDSDGLVNGQILNSDAVGVQALDLSASNIVDLTGIAAFANLEILTANDNQLTNVDVSSNPLLWKLEVDQNQLTSINIVNNAALIELDVSNNLLTALNLPNTTSLKTVKASYNQLTTIDLTNLTNLEYFRGSDNQLTTLDVSNNAGLKHLSCAKNQLTTLDVSNKPALKQLSCLYNQLTTLTITNTPALESINCVDNQLTTLNIPNAPALFYLNCSENQLTQLTVPTSTLLEDLDCSENQLTALNIAHCTSMRTLTLHDNMLTSLNLLPLVDLRELNVKNNSLTSLNLTGNTNLWVLNCSNNAIATLDMTNNTNVSTIYCSDNQITSLLVPNNTNLRYISCSDNQLASLDILNSPNLTSIGCYRNQLTNLNIPNSPNLSVVSAGENQLSSFNLLNHPNLTSFSVGENLFTSIDLSSVPALKKLIITSNQLTTLDVSNNPDLEDLFVGRNMLSALDVSNLLKLKRLDCSFNNISGMLDLTRNPDLDIMYCYANQLLRLQLRTTNLSRMYCQQNLYGLQICVPDTTAALSKPNFGQIAWVKDVHAVYLSENCYRMAVRGRIVIDSMTNCMADSLEKGLIHKMVRFQRGADVYYATTYNTNGNYIAHLDTGTYVVSVVTGSMYWQSCPSTQMVVIDTSSGVHELDWALEAVVSCPQLRVDISSPFLRLAGGGSYYVIDYCNEGTVMANNAYVEVDLDPSLSVSNSSVPIVGQNGNVYTFNIGNVPVDSCGEFFINVALDTGVLIGQTHCTEARIYPDSICMPNIWVNSRLAVDAVCQNDTVLFTINNHGAAMTQPTTYYVFEDNIMMRQNNFQIGVGGVQQVLQPADMGKTYRIITKQESGYPPILGDSIITAAVEGCRPYPDGSFNTGFITQFSNGNSSPFIAIDCQQNVASYDPNDKQAQPAGYDVVNHYIYDYTALDYKIRFQNTGTDTAFNIVILDTISPHLDLSTLEMGASSHNYTWSIQNGNVLNVKFANIMLPDSNVNEPLSNGFFRYRIEQKTNNPIGTVIHNSAAIYFDFNPPVITNTTWHTVGDDFVNVVLLDQTKVLDDAIEVTIYPNPFKQMTTLEVKGKDYKELELGVFDVTGRMIKQVTSTQQNRIELSRDAMIRGVYFYQLKGDGQLINTGKVVVQ